MKLRDMRGSRGGGRIWLGESKGLDVGFFGESRAIAGCVVGCA
jgi:hypothetical protein